MIARQSALNNKMCNYKTNILYLSHSAQLYGAEQSLLQLLKGLDRDRFSPVVALPQEGPLKQYIADLSIPVEIVPSIRAWLTRRAGIMRLLHHIGLVPFLAWSVWTLAKLIRRYHIELVHTNSLVIIDGALAARLLGIPHIWHAREMLVRNSPFNFLLGPRAALSLISRLSDRIIATTNVVRRCFDQKTDTSKIVVVYNAVDLSAFDIPQTGNAVRHAFHIPMESLLVGEVASLFPIKGYEDLVAAAAQIRQAIPQAMFIAVGDMPKARYERKIRDLIDSYDLQKSFILAGFQSDIASIFSALDLVVLPSRYETFGRVLVEAMAAGKPVIGTNVGGIPEIIEDGVTGLLVPPQSPDKLAEAVITILQNPSLARQMGEAGRQRVRERFSVEQHVARIQEIYEELRSSRKGFRQRANPHHPNPR
jgi:glycosyltransferase involved in cell wall biosynthesis